MEDGWILDSEWDSLSMAKRKLTIPPATARSTTGLSVANKRAVPKMDSYSYCEVTYKREIARGE